MWSCCIALVGPAGCGGLPPAGPSGAPARPPTVDTGILEHHLAIEAAVTGSPLTRGNRVVLLQDGPATYKAMLAAMAGARDHIHLETYILDDDEVGQRFVQALTERQAQGVQVLSLIHI